MTVARLRVGDMLRVNAMSSQRTDVSLLTPESVFPVGRIGVMEHGWPQVSGIGLASQRAHKRPHHPMTLSETNSERHRIAALARLIGGHVFLHACMSGLRMAAPLLALTAGYSKMHAGVLVALFALSQIFLALPAGRLADRRGIRFPMACGVIGCSAGAAMAALWPVYPVLCVSALLCGGATGVATIAMQRHVGRAARTPAELSRNFSWMSLAPAASNFLGPFSAGLMIDFAGFRWAFAMLAVFPLMAWLGARTAQNLVSASDGVGPIGSAWELWAQPSFRRLMLMNWFFSASWDIHGFMVPVLGHERGMAASAIGSVLGIFAVAAAVVRMATPWIAARLAAWLLITGALAITGATFLLYPFTSTLLAMGVCSAVLGAALGIVQPMILSMLHLITPDDRQGQAVAMRILMINVSSVATPIAFGTAGGLMGASGVFWLMGAIICAGSWLGIGLRGAGKGHEHRE